MGYRRPSKKHKGVKASYLENSYASEKIQFKINNPPTNTNEQKLPRVFRDVAKFMELAKEKPGPRNKQKQSSLIDTAQYFSNDIGSYPRHGKPFKPIPTIKQMPGEDSELFMKRVDKVTQMVIAESSFEEKYNVVVKRDEYGQVEELEPILTKEMKKRKIEKQKKIKARLENLKNKKKRKKKKKEVELSPDEIKESEAFKKERIRFQEVVHEPPNLSTEKLQKKINDRNMIKTKNLLFLNKMKGKEESPNQKEPPSKLRQKILERERERAILAYRYLQKQKKELKPR